MRFHPVLLPQLLGCVLGNGGAPAVKVGPSQLVRSGSIAATTISLP